MPQKGVPHHVRPGGLDDADQDRIHELAATGLSSHKIAAAIEKHPSTVAWFMYREGLMTPKRRDLQPFQRAGRVIHPFTREEDAFIGALRLQDVGLSEIARQATARFERPRTAHTISVRLSMLASIAEAA